MVTPQTNSASQGSGDEAYKYFEKAMALDNEDDYAGALKFYNAALKLDPEFQEAWYNKGNALYLLGRYREARKCFEQAVKLDDEDVEAYFSLGSVHSALDEYKGAIKYYNRALDIDDGHQPSWYNAACALYYLEKYDRALDCFDRAIELNSKDFDAWFGKGQTLRAQGRFKKAAKVFEHYVSAMPKNAEAWIEHGHALRDAGEYTAALNSYAKAAKLDAKSDTAKFYYNKVMQGLQRYQELVKFLFKTAQRGGGIISRRSIVKIFISSQLKYSIVEIYHSLKLLESKRILEVRENEFAIDVSQINKKAYDGNIYDFREHARWNEREHEILDRLLHHVLTVTEYIERGKLVEICGGRFTESEICAVLEKLEQLGDAKTDEYTVSVYI